MCVAAEVIDGRGWRSWILAAVGLGLLAGCGRKADPAPAAPPPVVIGAENLTVVQSTLLATGPTISGALAAERMAQVRAEVGGSVLEVRAEQGQRVKAGDVLARIDDAALRDGYLSARAALRSAQSSGQLAARNSERTARLGQAGAVADRDVEQARQSVASSEAAVADAQSRLVTAEKQLARATVRAPFTGVVSERQASAGDVVQPGALLSTIVDPSSMRLEASVPAQQVAALKVGAAVDFTVSGYEGKRFTGRIERINPSVDPATRQVRLYVAIPNAGRSLVAGLFAEGRVQTDARTAPSLPPGAIDERGTGPSVLRVRGARVERVPVELGVLDEVAERVEITRGVAPGDTVLLGSAQGLAAGTMVRVRQDAR